MIPAKCFVFRFSDVEVHEQELRATRGGEALDLEPKAFRVLVYLVKHAGHLVTKSELIDAVWGDTAVTDNSLTRVIALLRRVLEDDPRNPRFIETVSTAGYRFICEVEASADTVVSRQTPVISELPSSDLSDRVSAASVIREPSTVHSEARKFPTRVLWSLLLAVPLALILVWLMRPVLPPPRVLGTSQLTHDGATKIFANFPRPPLVTDGSRIYFQEIGPAIWPMTQVSTEGGETVHLDVSLPPYDLADISPDGRALLLGAWPPPNTDKDLQLWRVPVDPGMQPRRIGKTLIDWMAATLSPDGKALYFSLHSGLFVADADGSHPRKLVTIEGGMFWLRSSPDGRTLRFTSTKESGAWRLFEVHTDGSGLRQMFPGFSNQDSLCCGNWTTDGKYFDFESIHGQVATLWSVRDSGDSWRKISREPEQLTHGEIGAECPLPSKDGKKVFFVGVLRRGEVMRYDVKTQTLTPFLPGFSASGLDFTKDGKRMVYASFPEGVLWQSRIDGTDRHQLTFPPMLATTPRWSPDSSQIAFSGYLAGKASQVFVIPTGGGTPEQLTDSDKDSGDPTWSPDGNSLAYAGPWAVEPTRVPIHILNLRTREVTNVPNSAGLFSLRWSPDGRYLLVEQLGKKSGIVLYDFIRGSWMQLFDSNSAPGYPSWAKNGQCIYFNNSNLEYRVCLADRKVKQIADMARSGELAFTLAGNWTGLAPDGSILALRDTSTEEIYALDVNLP